MDTQRRICRLGAGLIAMSIGIRLFAGFGAQPLAEAWENGEIQAFLLYLETGRKVRFSPSLEENAEAVEQASPEETKAQPIRPGFSGEDMASLTVKNLSGRSYDPEALLTAPLDWELADGEPRVLILHTHATESYTRTTEVYTETAAYRTLAEGYNMISVGERVAQLLSQGGVGVIHDRELHDYPSYNGSYSAARKSIRSYLEQYPTVRLVLDLHRDAAGEGTQQLRTLAQVAGEGCAQLMLVVGTDAAGLTHSRWQENLSLALKLQVQLQRLAPGITRPVQLRSQRFNQDLSPGGLIVEVGAAGNTHAEALRAAEVLAQAILDLANGTGSD